MKKDPNALSVVAFARIVQGSPSEKCAGGDVCFACYQPSKNMRFSSDHLMGLSNINPLNKLSCVVHNI